MKKPIAILITLLLTVTLVYAVINITITVPLSESKYLDMQKYATNNNFLSVEAYFSNSISREVEGRRLSVLLELWQNASEAQRENALTALRQQP